MMFVIYVFLLYIRVTFKRFMTVLIKKLLLEQTDK